MCKYIDKIVGQSSTGAVLPKASQISNIASVISLLITSGRNIACLVQSGLLGTCTALTYFYLPISFGYRCTVLKNKRESPQISPQITSKTSLPYLLFPSVCSC